MTRKENDTVDDIKITFNEWAGQILFNKNQYSNKV